MPPKIRSSKIQQRMLVEYMAQHPYFANKEWSGPLGSQNYEEQWQTLARTLREHGPDKTVKAWQTTWRDLCRKARQKNAKANRARGATGNMIDVPIVGEEEELILSAIGHESSEGVGPEESRVGHDILRELRRSNEIKERQLELMRLQNFVPNRDNILEETEIIEEEIEDLQQD